MSEPTKGKTIPKKLELTDDMDLYGLEEYTGHKCGLKANSEVPPEIMFEFVRRYNAHDDLLAELKNIETYSCNFPEWWFDKNHENEGEEGLKSCADDLKSTIAKAEAKND